MYTLSEAIERARLLGENNIKDSIHEYTNNKNLNKYTKYTHRTQVWRKIHTDPSFKQVLDWGMSSGLLRWYCENYGIDFIGVVISRVKGYHDSYFTGQGSIGIQRVKLLRYIVGKEGTRM